MECIINTMIKQLTCQKFTRSEVREKLYKCVNLYENYNIQ